VTKTIAKKESVREFNFHTSVFKNWIRETP